MIKINVKLDIAEMKRGIEAEQKKVTQAISRGLNRAIDTAKITATREISAATKIKQGDIRQRLSIVGANVNYLIAELEAHPFSPNLGKFRATQNRRGVAASAWERRKTYVHAFMLRSGRVVTRTTNSRFPLKGLRGPSLPNTFVRPEIIGKIEAASIERFRREFERQLKALNR